MTHPDRNKNAAHGAGTPGGSTGEETPMAASQDNIPIGELIKERERVDAMGRLLFPGLVEEAPIDDDLPPDLSPLQRMRIQAGTSPLEMAAEELLLNRGGFIEAMKLTDCTKHRDLHFRLGNFVKDFDDIRALLMERCS